MEENSNLNNQGLNSQSNQVSNNISQNNLNNQNSSNVSNQVSNNELSNDFDNWSSDLGIKDTISSNVSSNTNTNGNLNANANNNSNLNNNNQNLDNDISLENNGYEETPIYEEVRIERQVPMIRTDSYYDGKLLELIGWNILRILLISITFTIAQPWADCMVLKYRLSHTVLNGKRLKFEGTGGELVVERFKWIFLTIVTLTIYAWFIPMKKKKWVLSHIHFEDEELVDGESFFDGKLIQLIGLNILSNLLVVISFGILYPLTNCLKLKWLAKHSIINKKKIVFDGSALSLWGHYLLWMFLTIITFGIYGLWLGIKMTKWEVQNSHIKLAGDV